MGCSIVTHFFSPSSFLTFTPLSLVLSDEERDDLETLFETRWVEKDEVVVSQVSK